MHIDYKKNNKKSFFKIIFAFALIIVQSAFFYSIWIFYYNELLRNPYLMKGNYFVTGIYAAVFVMFMIILDGTKFGDEKITNSIFSLSLANGFTNILIYLVVILPTYSRGFVAITPLFINSIKQEIFIIIWLIIVDFIFHKLYPPMPILLISNQKSIEEIFLKFMKKKKNYNIADRINSEKPMNEIKDKCNKFVNVLIGDIESEKRNDIIKYCFSNSINTYVMPKLSDIIIKSSKSVYMLDTPLYLSSNSTISFFDQFVKRLFDIIFSIISIIILLPIFLLVSILIKLEDGDKIFFIQKRVTKDYKIFNILKFRSMIEEKNNKVVPTTVDDLRITKVGKFIRKFHIDELPQLINVLIGDMSIVGPRPERVEHVELYKKEILEFQYRLKVKAGITGLAQIYGKYNTSPYDKLKLDLIYIKNYSLLLDLELIFKTFKVLVMKENTEAFDKKQTKYIMNNI